MTRTAHPLPATHGEFKFPRRNCLDALHPAERAVRDAMAAVEALGADPLLTDASTVLIKAKDLIADWLEGGTGLKCDGSGQ